MIVKKKKKGNKKIGIRFLLVDDIVKYSRSFTALPFYYKNIFSSFKKSYSRTKDSNSLMFIKVFERQLDATVQRLQESLKEKWYSFYTSTTTLLKFYMFSLLQREKGVCVMQRNLSTRIQFTILVVGPSHVLLNFRLGGKRWPEMRENGSSGGKYRTLQ